MVNLLVKGQPNGGAGGDGIGRSLGRIRLGAGVAADVVARDIGDWAVIVGVQANILVVARFGAVGDQICPAVVGQSSLGKRQQASRRGEAQMHDCEVPLVGVIDLVCLVKGVESLYE